MKEKDQQMDELIQLRKKVSELEKKGILFIETERKLTDVNQQLAANEQQLRASNQQLQANEQQLKAANQQFKANEQQLRAANQQLEASEKELRNSKETAERYLNVSAEIILSLDTNGNITLLNESGYQLLGYEVGTLIGKEWFGSCLTKKQELEVRSAFRQLMNGEAGNVAKFESDIITISGKIKTILWHNTVLKDKNGKIIGTLSSGEDITERKKIEINLADSLKREKIQADIVRNSPIAIAFGYPDGRLANCNKAFTKLCGYSEDELIKIDWNKKLTPSKWNKIEAEELNKLSPDNNSITYEKEYIHKNGNIIPIELVVTASYDENKKLIHFIGFIKDITERKNSRIELIKAKEKAEESEEYLENIIEKIADPIFVKDEDSKLLVVNDAFCQLMGLNKNNIIGKNLAEDVSPEEQESFLRIDKMVLNDGKDNVNVETITVRGGKTKIISTKKSRFIDEKGRKFLVGVIRDITESKQSEAELIKAKEKAEINEQQLRAANQQLQASEQQLRAANQQLEYRENELFNNQIRFQKAEEIGNTGNWEYDPVSTMFWASDQAKRIYGFDEKLDSLTTEMVEGCIPEQKRVHQALIDLLENNKEYDLVFDIITNDKGIRKTIHSIAELERDADGKPVKITGFIVDITKQKEAERELIKAKERAEENEIKFKAAFFTSPDAVNINKMNGEYVEINEGYTSLTGYTEEDTIGRLSSEINIWTIPEDRKKLIDALQKFGYIENLESVFKAKDGSLIPGLMSAKIITLNNEPYILSVTRAITERKKFEKELLVAKERAEESEERFNLAMNASNDGIFDWNLETNEIYYSPRWKEILGYEDYELPNDFSIWENLTEPEDVKTSWEMQQKVISKQLDRFVMEFKMKHKDGHWVDVLSQAKAIFDDSGKAIRFVGTHVDISERKKAEQELKESEVKYRKMIENMNSGVAIYKPIDDGKDFEFTDFNKAAERITNISLKDVKGGTLLSKFPNMDKSPLYKALQQVYKTGKDIHILPFFYKDNIREGWRENYIYKLPSDEIVAIFDDVTERKNAEIDLQNQNMELSLAKEKAEQSERRFKLLNRLTSEMLLLKDSESVYKFIGENLHNLYPNTFILNVSIDKSKQETRLEAATGLDYKSLNKVIDIAGFNPVGKIYKLTNIHNQYFKSGDFIEFNGGLAEFSASEFPHFAAKAIEKILGIHKIYTIGINNENGLLAAIHFITFKKQVITDGDFIEVFVKQVGLVIQKKLDEKNLILAKEKAEESDRLKSAFLANMSHEIRTPMNGILGFTSLLKEPNLNGEEQQTYIDIIQKSGNRMLNTVNDIIDISKIEAGQVELSIKEVNISEQLQYLYSFFKPEATKNGINLIFDNAISQQNITVLTDSEKFNSIVTNLIKNAIKFTKQGFIELGYIVNNRNKSDELEFYVKDNGIGIPKDRQKAIFERFIQADIEDKQANQGSGLGLAISKAYAEMLGGKMWVESEVGKGSTFYFTIKYNSKSKSNSKIENNDNIVNDANISKKHKILVVEDDKTSQYLISIMIEKFAQEIVKVSSGKEAVEACQNDSDIDLILMDLQMPNMNGYKATRQIRQFNKDVIIIAQTAYALTGDREKAIEAGCTDYISKPINQTELDELIRKYLYTSA